MRGRKIISLLMLTATLIFIIACLLFFNANQNNEAERGIEEAIKNYSTSIDEEEIKVLTREINDAVEKKLSEMNTKELTQKDLEELLKTVMEKLEVRTIEYRDTDITQEEINAIANEVIKMMITLKMIPSNEEELAKLEAYKILLDQLTFMQQELSGKLSQTEGSINHLKQELNGKLSQTEGSISNLQQELTGKLTQTEGSINDLQQELNGKLTEAEGSINDLQQELTGKLSETEGSISNLQQELKDKLSQTEERMNNQKLDTDSWLSQTENTLVQLQNQIGELERLFGTRLEQLEKKTSSTEGNLLYYDYDQNTQTLNVYGKKGE